MHIFKSVVVFMFGVHLRLNRSFEFIAVLWAIFGYGFEALFPRTDKNIYLIFNFPQIQIEYLCAIFNRINYTNATFRRGKKRQTFLSKPCDHSEVNCFLSKLNRNVHVYRELPESPSNNQINEIHDGENQEHYVNTVYQRHKFNSKMLILPQNIYIL